jgi:hypothetical protein
MSILSTLLVAAVCSAPQLIAQQSNPSTAQQPPETSSQQPQQPINTQPTNTQPAQTQPATQQPSAGQSQPQPGSQGTTNQGTTVNPSQAPLQPVTTYPDASDTQQQQPSPNAAPQTTTTIPEAPQPKKPSEPVGAATAESVPTTGGAAAKPAGVAIAPAKQHQTRSLMIKIGAALAAGAALGTVYALSHGTSSTPPGTGLAGVTGR